MKDIDAMTNQELFELVKNDVFEDYAEQGLQGLEPDDDEIWDITGGVFDLSYDLEK